MAQAHSISAEQVINEGPVTASSDESLSQLRHRMEENDLRAIPVVNSKGRLEGAVSYRELVRFIQFNPESTDLEKVMHQPPEFDLDASLVELADLRINSGRKMMVALDGDRLAGVMGDREFLGVLPDVDELEQLSTREIASQELITVFEEDSVEKARHAMLDNNISRLPVIDNNGKLTGMVDSVDILRMLEARDKQSPGGRSGRRAGTDEVNVAGGGEKERMSKVTVDQIMDRTPTISEQHLKGKEAVQVMLDRSSTEIVFVEDSYPEQIVTVKDFVKFLEGFSRRDTVLVQLTGVEVDEEKAVIHNQIRKQLQGSLGRKLKRPEEITLRVKKSEKDGKKHRYEIDLKLKSEYGLTNINADGWDLMDVVDEALNELNEVIRRKHDKRTEHH